MKKIANFTQTYDVMAPFTTESDGKDRSFLIDFLVRDENQKNIRNYLLDYPTYNFHNMDQKKTSVLTSKISDAMPRTEFFSYYGMTFGESISRHVRMLKDKGCTDLLWIQDDEFFVHDSFEDFKTMLNFYRSNENIQHICLHYGMKELGLDGNDFKSHTIDDHVKIYEVSARNIADKGQFGMNNTAFLCNIDLFLNKIFDESVIPYTNAYELELVMMRKSVDNDIPRFVCNTRFFRTFNIVGMSGSLGEAEKNLEELKNRFG